MTDEIGAKFRKRVEAREAMLVPGAANALAGRVIADLGYEAVFITGAGVTNTYFGMPDLSFISLPDIVAHTAAMRNAVDLPIIVDADTGFGNAVNMHYTVRELERAGANAIQIEDQVLPKKCGHFSGKAVVSPEEMAGKVRAAAEARRSKDFLIVARTDARAVEGFDKAVARARLYAEAGADILFVEAPESMEEVRRLPDLLHLPLLVNIVVGGKTPVLDQAELKKMGYALVLYANAALQGAVLGMQRALGALKRDGRLDESPDLVIPFAERQKLVDKSYYDSLEKRFAEPRSLG